MPTVTLCTITNDELCTMNIVIPVIIHITKAVSIEVILCTSYNAIQMCEPQAAARLQLSLEIIYIIVEKRTVLTVLGEMIACIHSKYR